MNDAFAAALIQAGPMGMFAGFLIWRDLRRDRIDQMRAQADIKLAETLAALKTVIESRHV